VLLVVACLVVGVAVRPVVASVVPEPARVVGDAADDGLVDGVDGVTDVEVSAATAGGWSPSRAAQPAATSAPVSTMTRIAVRGGASGTLLVCRKVMICPPGGHLTRQ
jgi:hypothetical protein